MYNDDRPWVTFDLETITPGFKITDDNKDLFPPLPYHEIVVGVFLAYEPLKGAFELRVHDCCIHEVTERLRNERILIQSAATLFSEASRIISFNGRSFDSPLLTLRAIRHSVPWVHHWDRRHRYPNYKQALFHYDVMDQLADFGAAGWMKLNDLCIMLGYPGKYDVGGADVGTMFKDGRHMAQIARYCAEDVLQTWLIYLRMMAVCEKDGIHTYGDIYKATISWAKSQQIYDEFFKQFDPPKARG